jgi:hypothetical protein
MRVCFFYVYISALRISRGTTADQSDISAESWPIWSRYCELETAALEDALDAAAENDGGDGDGAAVEVVEAKRRLVKLFRRLLSKE